MADPEIEPNPITLVFDDAFTNEPKPKSKSKLEAEGFMYAFSIFIGHFIAYLNEGRHQHPFNYFANRYVRLILDFIRDGISHVLQLLVRKSDCYVVAVGIQGKMWVLGERWNIPGYEWIGYGGSYNDLGGTSDITINYQAFYQAVLLIWKDNQLPVVSEKKRKGWKRSIALLIMFTSESARFKPVYEKILPTLGFFDRETFQIESGDWMHKIVAEWKTLSGLVDHNLDPIPYQLAHFDVEYPRIMDPNHPERKQRASAIITVLHLPAPDEEPPPKPVPKPRHKSRTKRRP